jgi:hypothetical protein
MRIIREFANDWLETRDGRSNIQGWGMMDRPQLQDVLIRKKRAVDVPDRRYSLGC